MDKVQVPDVIRVPNSNGGHEEYVFNAAVEHTGVVQSGHYKLHVKDAWGFATIDDDKPAKPTNLTSIQSSTLFFYGKKRFYDWQGPSPALDISEEVEMAVQQSMMQYQEEEDRVLARKTQEEEEAKNQEHPNPSPAVTRSRSNLVSSAVPSSVASSSRNDDDDAMDIFDQADCIADAEDNDDDDNQVWV